MRFLSWLALSIISAGIFILFSIAFSHWAPLLGVLIVPAAAWATEHRRRARHRDLVRMWAEKRFGVSLPKGASLADIEKAVVQKGMSSSGSDGLSPQI